MIQEHPWENVLAQKLRRIAEFLASQGVTLAGNLLYGFLCMRLLSIPEYAKYAVVFGFLGTLVVLMDIGVSNALLPLVGEQIDNRQLIADYVASLRQLSHWLYILVMPVVLLLFPVMVRQQHWNWRVVAGMIVSLLIASWCARISGAYGAVLIIRRDRTYWYRIQMIASFGLLLLLAIVYLAHWLTAFSAIAINLAGTTFTAAAYFLRAHHLLGVRGRSSKKARGELIHLTIPNAPFLIFYALQGQISLLLITFFGRTTAVASVGALNRLGQIYSLLSRMNILLLEPYFARLPGNKVKRSYLATIALVAPFCIAISVLARYCPGIFLWILGPKYSQLRYEVFLVMALNSINYLNSVLGVMNSARRFIYWWSGAASVILTLVVEATFILKIDLSTVRAVLYLGLATVIVNLIICAFTGLYGFLFGPRLKRTAAPAAQQVG